MLVRRHEIHNAETNETSKRQKAFRAVQGLNNSEKVFTKNFIIITASNPNGSYLPRRHNREANERLEKDLNTRYIKVKGKYNDIEDSYICYDLPLSKAKYLAKKYDQEAFIEGKHEDDHIRYDYYKSDRDDYGNLLGVYNKVDTTCDIEDVTNDLDCFTQLCRRFKFKIRFPSFEGKFNKRVRELFQDDIYREAPVKVIFNDDEVKSLLAEATNTGIMLKHRIIAKKLLKRHYEALGLKPPKECF